MSKKETELYPPLPASKTGLHSRCPRCGQGPLFSGLLAVAPRCRECGLDFAFIDSDDGPAVFAITIVGVVVVALALFVEFTYAPPYWIHAALWVPLIFVLSIGLLRPIKGLLIAQQFLHRAKEGQIAEP